MEQEKLRTQLEALIDRIVRVRTLSTMRLDNLEDANDYSRCLRNNFKEIGRIASENRKLLEEILYPMLESDERIPGKTVQTLQEFCRLLLNPWSEEELDLSLLFHVSRRLLADALKTGEDDYIIYQLYIHINACYANLNRTNRIRVSEEISDYYKQEGLAASERILAYLAPERFAKLQSDDSRKYVLIHSRFFVALYDTFYVTPMENEERIRRLQESYRLAEDPFYREHAPEYDWRYHRIRCLEHLGQLTEGGNAWGFTKEQCREIAAGVEELDRIWQENPEESGQILPPVHLQLIKVRSAYFDDRISLKLYQRKLLELYNSWANDQYDMYSVLANIFIPVEYLSTFSGGHLNEEEKESLNQLYSKVIYYILHSVNSDAFYFLLEYLSALLERFVEIPGMHTFEEMGLNCLAALHPPTYVHSLQVGKIARCLCEHMIWNSPELLIGVDGCESVEDVLAGKDHILHHIYHAALCHDFGKISMMDTIFVYGRKLLDSEFEIIKHHPDMGAGLLARYETTKDYANIARGHHRWYDNSRGYPEDFDTNGCPDKVLIDIVSVADSLDAATDSVGRSYNRGKTLEDILVELREQSGTRYSPHVVKLFEQEMICQNIDYLLHEGRNRNYSNTYLLLKGAVERAELLAEQEKDD